MVVPIPDGAFTAADARALAITSRQLAHAVHDGTVRRYLRGVYVPGRWPDDLEHRARAAARVLGPGRVFVDRTAAWLHGVDVFGLAELEAVPPVETAVATGRRANRASGVRGRSRELLEDEVMGLRGVRLTTPTRTALDLACNLRRAEALAALDAFARLHAVTQQDLFCGLVRFKGRRGVVQARQLVPLMDPRAESARESHLRLAMADAGLPTPTLQHVVVVEGHEFRLDHAYPARRVGVEYDGEPFHTSAEQRLRDERRRELLRRAGWTVIVVRRGDLSAHRMPVWLDAIRQALHGGYTSLRW